MGLDKAKRYMAHRKALLVAAEIAKKAGGGTKHSTAFGVDIGPSAVGVLTIETRPANKAGALFNSVARITDAKNTLQHSSILPGPGCSALLLL